MTGKKITIALISDNSEEFKRFCISKYLIVLTLIFLISCAACAGWLMADYQVVKSKMPLLVGLQRESEAQRMAFAQLADRVKEMTQYGDTAQTRAPNGNGHQKQVWDGQSDQIPDVGVPELALIQSKYAMGGGEPANALSNPTEQPSSPKEMATYPYALQIGSYRTLKRADKALSIYRKKNLSPYCVKVDLGENGQWFRVFVGHFKNKESAKNYKQEHKIIDGLIKRIAHATLIGIYSAEEQFENEFLMLEKNGYFPYVIKDDQDMFRLYVGAFFTRAGAETQHALLLERGFNSEIVKR